MIYKSRYFDLFVNMYENEMGFENLCNEQTEKRGGEFAFLNQKAANVSETRSLRQLSRNCGVEATNWFRRKVSMEQNLPR